MHQCRRNSADYGFGYQPGPDALSCRLVFALAGCCWGLLLGFVLRWRYFTQKVNKAQGKFTKKIKLHVKISPHPDLGAKNTRSGRAWLDGCLL